MTIVNYNLTKPAQSQLSFTYVPETGTGEGVAQGLQSLASSIQTTASIYKKASAAKAEAASQERLMEYENAVADLKIAAENSSMTNAEKVSRIEMIQRNFSDVKATDRANIDSRYGFNVVRDLYKKTEEQKIDDQHAADKALVTTYSERLPHLFSGLDEDSKLAQAKQMDRTANILAGYVTANSNELTAYDKRIYLDATEQAALTEARNWLAGLTGTGGITLENFEEAKTTLANNFTAAGFDSAISSEAANKVFANFEKNIKEYTEDSKVSKEAAMAYFTNQFTASELYAIENADKLKLLGPEQSNNLVLKLMNAFNRADANGKASVNHALSFKGKGYTNIPEVSAESLQLAGDLANSASNTDEPIQRNIKRDVVGNVTAQMNVAAFGTPTPTEEDIERTMNETVSLADTKTIASNLTIPLSQMQTLAREYYRTAAPSEKVAIKDQLTDQLRTKMLVSLFNFKKEAAGFTDQDYRVAYVSGKGPRLYEKASWWEWYDKGKDTTVKDAEGSWVDITEDRPFLNLLGEAPQESFRNIRGIIDSNFADINTIADEFKRERIFTDEELGSLWKESIDKVLPNSFTAPGEGANVAGSLLEGAAQTATALTTAPGIVAGASAAGLQNLLTEQTETAQAARFKQDSTGAFKVIFNGREMTYPQAVSKTTGVSDKEAEKAYNMTLAAIDRAGDKYDFTPEEVFQISLTQAAEGLRTELYKDSKKVDTIGYGTNAESLSKENEELLNRLVPNWREGGKVPAELATVLLLNSFKDAKTFLETTKEVPVRVDKNGNIVERGDVAISDIYASLPQTVRSALLDMTYNLGPDGIKKFFKMFEAFEEAPNDNRKYVDAMIEILDSKYLTDVGERSRRNIAAVSLALQTSNRKGVWNVFKSKAEAKGLKDKIKTFANHLKQAEKIDPAISEVF